MLLPAAFAEEIPDTESSTTNNSDVGIFSKKLALVYISGSGFDRLMSLPHNTTEKQSRSAVSAKKIAKLSLEEDVQSANL
jgi:hypothetical protein